MVLRKPYAFLIRNFKKINILLLILVTFLAYKSLSLYGFLREYTVTAIYNENLNSITNYINGWVYFSLILVLFLAGALAYLLKYKNKPFAVYIFLFVSNLLSLILFLYVRSYFNYVHYSVESARNITYLTLVVLVPYLPEIFILLIRSIGLDLKRFGFGEDKEFAETSEADREEVEVEVAFDKDVFIRTFRNKLRILRYFFLEHKFSLSVIAVVVLLVTSYMVYNYVYVYHKIYGMNQSFQSNYYRLTVQNAYITDKDFAGNVVSKENKYYFILDFKVENLLSESRDFDMTKFILYVDDQFYVPDVRFNNYFNDIGNVFKNKAISSRATENYIFVYEINPPTAKSNFLLTYQDLLSKDTKTIRVKIKVRNISEFILKDTKKMDEDMEIPINLDEKMKFNFYNMTFANSLVYTYEKCYVKNCPIYEGNLTANSGKVIARLKGNFNDASVSSFLSFLKKYGKVRYTVDNVQKEENIELALSEGYRGRMVYLSLPQEVQNATELELLFTVRTYQYVYRLKGEM